MSVQSMEKLWCCVGMPNACRFQEVRENLGQSDHRVPPESIRTSCQLTQAHHAFLRMSSRGTAVRLYFHNTASRQFRPPLATVAFRFGGIEAWLRGCSQNELVTVFDVKTLPTFYRYSFFLFFLRCTFFGNKGTQKRCCRPCTVELGNVTNKSQKWQQSISSAYENKHPFHTSTSGV